MFDKKSAIIALFSALSIAACSGSDEVESEDDTGQTDEDAGSLQSDSGSDQPDAGADEDTLTPPEDAGSDEDVAVPPTDTGTNEDVAVPPTDTGTNEDVAIPPSDTGDSCTTDFAPEAIVGSVITFDEAEGTVVNTWTFTNDTTAALSGVGDFPYTFEKPAACTTVIIFDVGGSDRYDMVWTSATGGTFEESFDGAPGNPGTFTVE